MIVFSQGAWRTVEKKPKKVVDPPKAPKYLPGWWVRFTDEEMPHEMVGKIGEVSKSEDGIRYTIIHGYCRYEISARDIVGRMESVE